MGHRPFRAIHGATFHKHCTNHIVTITKVSQQLRQQVGIIGVVPQMMVRVTDPPLGIQDRFPYLSQPSILRLFVRHQ